MDQIQQDWLVGYLTIFKRVCSVHCTARNGACGIKPGILSILSFNSMFENVPARDLPLLGSDLLQCWDKAKVVKCSV